MTPELIHSILAVRRMRSTVRVAIQYAIRNERDARMAWEHAQNMVCIEAAQAKKDARAARAAKRNPLAWLDAVAAISPQAAKAMAQRSMDSDPLLYIYNNRRG